MIWQRIVGAPRARKWPGIVPQSERLERGGPLGFFGFWSGLAAEAGEEVAVVEFSVVEEYVGVGVGRDRE